MARLIEGVQGHEHSIEQLQSLIQTDRWPNALLFLGPSGIGKKKIALAFAQMLICAETPFGCGLCGACLRVEKQQSESLIVVQPDPELSRKVIKVDDIRDVLKSLSLSGV